MGKYEIYEKTECCICGKEIRKYGNNPYPVSVDGVCCDACNITKVIPMRLSRTYRMLEAQKGWVK